LNSSHDVYNSKGTYDGYVLESSELSNKGGTMNSSSSYLFVGDDASDRQYRSFLSFDTSALPDNAVITSLTLKVLYRGKKGTNPFSTHGDLIVDLKKPYWGSAPGLELSDFNSSPTLKFAGKFSSTSVESWYIATLPKVTYVYINLKGTTQFRLRFLKDDNDDRGADYINFYSGNYGDSGYRPRLEITYYIP
jgi:hypothetical protein